MNGVLGPDRPQSFSKNTDQEPLWQPWWLPSDLRLTTLGVSVYEVVLAILALTVLLAALAVVGKVELS